MYASMLGRPVAEGFGPCRLLLSYATVYAGVVFEAFTVR